MPKANLPRLFTRVAAAGDDRLAVRAECHRINETGAMPWRFRRFGRDRIPELPLFRAAGENPFAVRTEGAAIDISISRRL